LDARGGEHAPNIATEERVQTLSDAELQRIVHTGIPGAGMPGFAKTLKPEQIDSVIGYLRTLQRTNDARGTTGDAAAGKTLFFGRARCSECHSVNGSGGFLASDLSGYGRSHSAGQIRLLIEDRPEVPEAKLLQATVLTKSGGRFSGLIRNEDNFSLQLQRTDGAYVLLDKREIASIKLDKAYLHGQYFRGLSPADVQNLISFLLKTTSPQTVDAHEDE
jgi:putative heme-binding domain-containing protein